MRILVEVFQILSSQLKILHQELHFLPVLPRSSDELVALKTLVLGCASEVRVRRNTSLRQLAKRAFLGTVLPVVIVVSALIGAGCTKDKKQAHVTIQFPESTASQKSGQLAASSHDWATDVPTSLGDIGCYAIVVGGDEPEQNSSSCSDDSGATLIRFGTTAGLYSAGSTATLEVPAGPNRRFFVIGLKLVNGSCENIAQQDNDLTASNYSPPYILGKAVATLVPGENNVQISLVNQFDTSNKIGDCSFLRPSDGNVTPTPSPAPTPTPAPAPTSVSVSQLALGTNHTCALTLDGKIKCWGNNGFGALGQNNTINLGALPSQMGDALPYVNLGAGRTAIEVVAGNNFTCARLDNGQVKCWGVNTFGQLGLGHTMNMGDSAGEMGSLPPVNLGTGRTATLLTAGNQHVCALRDDNSVVCWGRNESGQLGISAPSVVGASPANLGDNFSAINFFGDVPIQIDAGSTHTCAVFSTGQASCWGSDTVGQLGNGISLFSGFSPEPVEGITSAVEAIVGPMTTCFRLSSGAVKCAGQNSSGLFGNNTTTASESPVTGFNGLGTLLSAGVGSGHACAINSGDVFCWGNNFLGRTGQNLSSGILSLPSVIPALTGGDYQKVFVPESGGGSHTCAINTSGHFKCWGDNAAGQLGYGDTLKRGDASGSMEALIFVDLGIIP